MPKLSEEPSRLLTSRECAKILGGVLGPLVQMAPFQEVKTALEWWTEHLDKLNKLEISIKLKP